MNGIFIRQLSIRATAIVIAASLLSSCASPSPNVEPSLKTHKAKVEGVYALQEWHFGGEVLRPPRCDGRFVLQNGVVVTILHNRASEARQTTGARFGTYVLDATQFSYRYDDNSFFTQTASGITVSHKPPWEGMRAFASSAENNAVRLRTGDGLEEFVFTADGLTYSENGKVSRVWRRVSE